MAAFTNCGEYLFPALDPFIEKEPLAPEINAAETPTCNILISKQRFLTKEILSFMKKKEVIWEAEIRAK